MTENKNTGATGVGKQCDSTNARLSITFLDLNTSVPSYNLALN